LYRDAKPRRRYSHYISDMGRCRCESMVLNQFVWLGNENKRLCIVHRELVQWDGGDLLYITIIPLIFVVTEFMDEKIEWNNFHYDYYVDNS